MPLSKPEVALEFFGVEADKYENDEAFREEAAKAWTKTDEAFKHPEVVSKVMGKANAMIADGLKKAFKSLDLPTDGVDFTKPAETVSLLADNAKKAFADREAKLAESLKGKGTEEAKKEYERQLGEQAKKVTEFEGVIASLRGDLEKRDAAEKQREHEAKVRSQWETAKATGLKDIAFKNDLEKTGFEAVAQQRFKVLFDEGGAPYWGDAEGKRIADGAKHQVFKDGAQLLKELAIELKVGNGSARGGAPVGTPKTTPERERTGIETKPIRIIARPGRSLNEGVPA